MKWRKRQLNSMYVNYLVPISNGILFFLLMGKTMFCEQRKVVGTTCIICEKLFGFYSVSAVQLKRLKKLKAFDITFYYNFENTLNLKQL